MNEPEPVGILQVEDGGPAAEALRRIKADERDSSDGCQLGANGDLVGPVGFGASTEVVAQLGMHRAVLDRLPGDADRGMRG